MNDTIEKPIVLRDRRDGGRRLVPELKRYRAQPAAIVLGLPRGGVVTAAEITAGLDLPLDVIISRKIGAPENPEFAIGGLSPTRACSRRTKADGSAMTSGGGAHMTATHGQLIDVTIPVGRIRLEGILGVPEAALGLVLFAHGSGSSRLSPRNTRVAAALREAGIGTLLFDLLTPEEAEDRRNVFDIEMLARRLHAAAEWARSQKESAHLRIGYFGASTGAAAALIAAAGDAEIGAVVARGGRPDLAPQFLAKVKAPTLLIVGGDDVPVIEMNQQAFDLLRCEKDLQIVPGASHLFEEPGTLEEVVRLATAWFRRCLSESTSGEPGRRR
jgi:dienelactone hydrolase